MALAAEDHTGPPVSSTMQPSNTPEESPTRAMSPEKPFPTSFNPGWRFYVAFSSLSVISLMAALDATSLSVALPTMARLLGGSAIEAFWSGTSFLLTSTVVQPVFGSLSHIFGRKPLIYTSLVLFVAGAIIAALADNFTVILVGRSVQGVGGGGILVLTEVVVTDMVPLRERGKWMSFISSMWAIGTVTGPLLGGGFAENVTWRWIFWINLPFAGVGFVLVLFFLTLNHQTSSLLQKLRRVDWVGIFLFLSSITGFLIPLTWGGVMYPWSSWRTLVPLILCGCGLVAFVVHQEYFATEPLIRTKVMKSRTAAVTYFGTIVHGIVLWGLLYYGPLYYEGVKGLSSIMTGVALFPQTFTVAPAAIVVGFVVAKTGRYREAIWLGWGLTTLGMGILVYLQVDTSTVAWVFMNLVSGLGTGILFPASVIALQASVKAEDQAYSITIYSFFRSFGQTLGVAVGGVIFQNEIRNRLLTYPIFADRAAELAQDSSGLVQILKAMPDGSSEKYQLQEAYTYALTRVWLVMCVLAGLAFIASWFTQAFSIDVEMSTEQGFQHERRKSDEEKQDRSHA